ncbi:MAG TPA: hypothetical protein VMB82_04675 [Acidimicrobiales bacterium]|nr:hypothetical protein [Acidimicrobiales bacterium]
MADDLGPEATSVGRDAGRPDGGPVDGGPLDDGGPLEDGGIVDEESDESFPASDAPSWWAGEDAEV